MRTVSLTEGSIVRGSLLFTVPLILGNLFQQLYSATDSLVVGNFVGSGALAAVSASNQIVNLVIGFVIGLTTGAGIVIARHYGAGEYAALRRCISTAYLFCLVGGAAVSALGIAVSPVLLHLINTPEEIFADSVLYLRIYFLGTLFNILYNMGAGVLQAVADTRHPLYYLCAASAVNIILDVLFVAVFRWGVAGVAAATLIAQALSAALAMTHLLRTREEYRLCSLRGDREEFRLILKYGTPTGLQSAIVSLSNVVGQGYLNGFGVAAMAGSNVYSKVDTFVLLPVNCLSLTVTTFTAQNMGARRYDRVRSGLRAFLWIGGVYSIGVGIFMFFFSQGPMSLFSQEADVLHSGAMMARVLAPGYILLVFCQILIGTVRGCGHTFATMVLSVINLCGLRIVWLAALLPLFPSLYTLYLGYPVTWGSAAACIALYYHFCVVPHIQQRDVLGN